MRMKPAGKEFRRLRFIKHPGFVSRDSTRDSILSQSHLKTLQCAETCARHKCSSTGFPFRKSSLRRTKKTSDLVIRKRLNKNDGQYFFGKQIHKLVPHPTQGGAARAIRAPGSVRPRVEGNKAEVADERHKLIRASNRSGAYAFHFHSRTSGISWPFSSI